MKTLIRAAITALAIVPANSMASGDTPIGSLEHELVHDDSVTSFHAASFQLIADECVNHFAENGIQLNSFWWNVRIVLGGDHTEWRVILTSVTDEPKLRMCQVVLDFPENSRSNYTVTEIRD